MKSPFVHNFSIKIRMCYFLFYIIRHNGKFIPTLFSICIFLLNQKNEFFLFLFLFFYLSTFSFFQPNTYERKLNFFYLLTFPPLQPNELLILKFEIISKPIKF